MDIILKFDTAGVNWHEAAEIYRRAPLWTREPDKLRRGFEKSFVVCFAFDRSKIVGLGRAISDGEYYACIYDIVVLPEYQNKGIGKMIMESIHERLPLDTITLFAVKGKEPFYRKCGYKLLMTAMARVKNPDGWRKMGLLE